MPKYSLTRMWKENLTLNLVFPLTLILVFHTEKQTDDTNHYPFCTGWHGNENNMSNHHMVGPRTQPVCTDTGPHASAINPLPKSKSIQK